jgi:hypothetical protein
MDFEKAYPHPALFENHKFNNQWVWKKNRFESSWEIGLPLPSS